uniref:C2H2-type domain-containing protein n=1 Tax=Dicentrarchus labrax TaxID=13489 RepID=A0A8C4NZB8_DICLA
MKYQPKTSGLHLLRILTAAKYLSLIKQSFILGADSLAEIKLCAVPRWICSWLIVAVTGQTQCSVKHTMFLNRTLCCALKKTFVCSLCPETFECRQSLADHENLHSGNRDFVCEMCGECFFSSSSLATHRVTHMQKENCCDVLGLGCSDLSVLKNHLSKHTGEKLFNCKVCGKGCSHLSALKHHMLTHTGERPYKPGIHTGEKPYACNQCDKKFSNPSNLKLHAMTHSGEKMYGCNICGRRFTQSSSLKLHRQIHTGERPYRCSVCGKGFTHNRDFKKHQSDHQPDGDGQSEKTAVKI